LHGSHITALSKLQRMQNNIARVVLRVRRRAHALPLLHQLHWLPVEPRITYKLAVLTFRTRQHSSPKLLHELLVTRSRTRTLRSANRPLLEIPLTRTVYAGHTFRVAAPTIWNSLPTDALTCSTVDTFKKHSKTHLFNVAFQHLNPTGF
jgi:hypothetical protein